MSLSLRIGQKSKRDLHHLFIKRLNPLSVEKKLIVHLNIGKFLILCSRIHSDINRVRTVATKQIIYMYQYSQYTILDAYQEVHNITWKCTYKIICIDCYRNCIIYRVSVCFLALSLSALKFIITNKSGFWKSSEGL